jgi:hypothetical protein
MREQNALAQHPLIPHRKLELGKREGVPKVQGAVHVRVRVVAEPFWVLLADLSGRGEALRLLRGGSIDFEELFARPEGLIFFL